jgi:hypothetical protein
MTAKSMARYAVSAVARFVIDDEPLVGTKGEPFARGGVLTFVDARSTGAGRRTGRIVVLAAIVALAILVGLPLANDAPSSDRPARSTGTQTHHHAADVPALVIGVATPGRRGASPMARGPRLAGRR